MFGQALAGVFADAAIPQRGVLILLVGAVPVIVASAVLAVSRPGGPWRRLISDLSFAGPALGLLVGAMNAVHMTRTIDKLAFDVTARQLAPGVREIAVLVGWGAVVGLTAILAGLVVDGCRRRVRP